MRSYGFGSLWGLAVLALVVGPLGIMGVSLRRNAPVLQPILLPESRGISLLQTQAQLWAQQGQAPVCQELTQSLCKACTGSFRGPPELCQEINALCTELFCDGFCHHALTRCTVTFGGDFVAEKAQAERYSQALCGQFISELCVNALACCPDDQRSRDYLENLVFADSFPEPLLPTPTCRGVPPTAGVVSTDGRLPAATSDLCGACKAAVTVAFEDIPCPYVASDPDSPEQPGYTNLLDRCQQFQLKAAAARTQTVTKFKEKLCSCMGCCEPKGECFFRVSPI